MDPNPAIHQSADRPTQSPRQPVAQPPTLLIAGQASGVGKTTITLGIIAALRRRGLAVQPFKCGPDYIDPTYLGLAAGRACRNLDTWMLRPEQMVASFQRAVAGADVAVIEGVMGLFDGSSYREEQGSAAQIAKLLGAPVLLILDIGKLARSAGALALGFQQFDPELDLAGFLLNRAGSRSHAAGCQAAIHQATGLPVLGWLPKESGLHIPERHLGLVPTDERTALDGLLQAAGAAVEAHFQLDRILEVAARARRGPALAAPLPDAPPRPAFRSERSAGAPLLAVARDEAFSFYYPDNLELLAEAGARIHFFSPLRDRSLPEETAGLYLGGGFPELYAAQLGANRPLWQAVAQLHAAGRPIYAECGGFMVLTQTLVDLEGRTWPMAGLLPGTARMVGRLAGLGYRVATALEENLLLPAGAQVRGHEFHYSVWDVAPEAIQGRRAWSLQRRQGDEESRLDGYAQGNLLASYLHVHFGQDPSLAARFVARMADGQGAP